MGLPRAAPRTARCVPKFARSPGTGTSGAGHSPCISSVWGSLEMPVSCGVPQLGGLADGKKCSLMGLIGGINCICRTLTHLSEQEQSRPGGSLKPPLGMWGGVPHPSPCLMAVGRSRCWLKPPCPGIYSFPALQMRCVPGAGAVGSGQWLFAAFSYLLLGRWNRVLEQSPVSHRASPRGALPRAPVPPPSLQVAWQAGTCENQFCTRVPGIQQAALLGCK